MIPLAAAVLLAQGASARWEVDPTALVIGQPTVAHLVVEHDAGDRPDLGAVALDLDDSWVVVDDGVAVTRPAGTGRARTERTWTALSLEPGERAWPALHLALASGAGLDVDGPTWTVAGELGENEDAPRPLPDFHEVRERAGPLRPLHWALVAAGLAVAGGAWWLARRAGRRAADEPVATPAERLRAARPADWDVPGVASQYAFVLSGVLREVAGARGPGIGPGATDEELLAELRASGALPTERLDALAALLARCAEIKFAGARPTRFALEELAREGEALLPRLAPQSVTEVQA